MDLRTMLKLPVKLCTNQVNICEHARFLKPKVKYTIPFRPVCADYTSLATNSASVKQIAGFPMVNVIATADSKRGASSTGNIYFLLTNLDYTGQDLMKSNKLTMLFTQDQDLQCTSKGLDAMDPTCARVIMSGSAIVVSVVDYLVDLPQW